MTFLRFKWELHKKLNTIIPVFLPFAGCNTKCIYCAQDIQTGIANKVVIDDVLNLAKNNIEKLFNKKKLELAFYGGTFTNININDFNKCCNFAKNLIEEGKISSWRCSTKPDCINKDILEKLRGSCCTTIELGIQSFYDNCIIAVNRTYTRNIAEKACKLVKDYDFNLGIQLMPGMPENTPSMFLNDVKNALNLKANFLRFYPCLVLKNTKLAKMWENKEYIPWGLDDTIVTLAKGFIEAQKNQTPVIRIGIMHEDNLQKSILAGPWHESLGSCVKSMALYMYICDIIRDKNVHFFKFPQSFQGFLWGDKGNMRNLWKDIINLNQIKFWDKDWVEIDIAE